MPTRDRERDSVMDLPLKYHSPTWVMSGFALIFMALAFLVPASASETQSYVVSFVMPAGYAYDGDCERVDPAADAGDETLRSFRRRKLSEAGRTPGEIDKIFAIDNPGEFVLAIARRGRVNGRVVNVLGNPE